MEVIESYFDNRIKIFKFFKNEDLRGYFLKPWAYNMLENFKVEEIFVTFSKKNVIRGLHYILLPSSQKRIVICLKGRILDAVVDIRKGSPTFGKHVLFKLSEFENKGIFIDVGFAHGFLALEDSLLLYLADKKYDPSLDRGIIWNDPTINIPWNVSDPIISERDKNFPLLKDAEINFYYSELK